MCEQCLARTIDVVCGEFLPGWFLVLATGKGYVMQRGDYGLLRCNDPDFVIPASLKPVPDPAFSMSDEQFDAMSEEEIGVADAFDNLVCDIEGVFLTDPVVGYKLVTACKAAGWDPEVHGWRIMYWLTHRMGEAIAEFWKQWPDGLPDFPAPMQEFIEAADKLGLFGKIPPQKEPLCGDTRTVKQSST